MSLHTVERELTGAVQACVQRQHDNGFHFGCSHRMSVIDEMEAWLEDCGWHVCLHNGATAATIVNAIEARYDGGVNQFVADQS